ncbi:porin [Caenimonas aquaedulcis]|uniref:Porin n=1 Tax=Caenimonas aquaedulcis TaxID=2793270 RepID=A0A931H3U4_9BURK|nr:porin [Caenimonas aquaedulcis]MBG9388064.1 porin [Caenimonas aquaedulcis]
MKLSHFALATAACIAAGNACAQSNVTIGGIVDINLAHGSGSIANKSFVGSSGIGASQLRFTGVEDLGGQLRAGFWLDSMLQPDSGAGTPTNTNNQASGGAAALAGSQGLTFNRRSTLSLGGPLGELRLGRDYTPSYWNLPVYDPFGNLGVGSTHTLNGAITGATGVRASNAIAYYYGHAFNAFATGQSLQGLNVGAMAYAGENASNAADAGSGNGASVRVGWTAPAWSVAAATGRTRNVAGDLRQTNLGGAYDFGVVRVMGHLVRDRNGAVTAKGYLLGLTAAVGIHQWRASVSAYETDAPGRPKATKLAVGYVHNLSKRTAVYATGAVIDNEGGAAFGLNQAVTAPNARSRGFDLGVRHSF